MARNYEAVFFTGVRPKSMFGLLDCHVTRKGFKNPRLMANKRWHPSSISKGGFDGRRTPVLRLLTSESPQIQRYGREGREFCFFFVFCFFGGCWRWCKFFPPLSSKVYHCLTDWVGFWPSLPVTIPPSNSDHTPVSQTRFFFCYQLFDLECQWPYHRPSLWDRGIVIKVQV